MTFFTATTAVAVIAFAVLPGTAAIAGTKNADVIVTRTDLEIPVRKVVFDDLNLGTPSGERKLMWRVRAAAHGVCQDSGFDEGSIAAGIAMNRCRVVTMGGARPQMEAAVRRARDLASTGRSVIAAAAITVSAAR